MVVAPKGLELWSWATLPTHILRVFVCEIALHAGCLQHTSLNREQQEQLGDALSSSVLRLSDR